MHRALAGIHVEHRTVGSGERLSLSDQVAVHGHQSDEVVVTGEQLGLEPGQHRGQRRAPVPPRRRADQAERACLLGGLVSAQLAPSGDESLPATIPLFPLQDVVLFPNTTRTLYVFETRYRAMVVLAILTPIWHEKAQTAQRVRQRVSAVIRPRTVLGGPLQVWQQPSVLCAAPANTCESARRGNGSDALDGMDRAPSFRASLSRLGDLYRPIVQNATRQTIGQSEAPFYRALRTKFTHRASSETWLLNRQD